ncbi:MAG: cytochrome P450 [Pseudomonadota bacterium]
MSVLTSTDVLRPGPRGFGKLVMKGAMAALPFLFRVLRRIWPVPHLGKMYVATLHDDVLEVFATDAAFGVPYKDKLDLIMGREPFFLGMGDGPQYREDTAAMRKVIRPGDLPMLGAKVEAMAEAIVAGSNGRVEVVDQLVRRVTFDYCSDYFGVPDPPGGDLRVWGTRLFEYQFVASDQPLIDEVKVIAPALRDHIDGLIADAKKAPEGRDDVLARCVAMQAAGEPGFSDKQIRTALMGFIVGGPPQPPMVVPQAMEQLLRRPEVLAGAQAAARANDDALLHGYVIEAMRFDPLAPGLPRMVLKDWTIGKGTAHECTIPAGATLLNAFASGMMDGRRVPDPRTFNPRRLPHEYIHFGHALHQCFGIHMNHATLHMMLKPLLKRDKLRRARGAAGKLAKRGPFAEALTVEFG